MDGIPDELCDCAIESTESVERTRVGPVLHVKRTPCGNSTADPAEIEYRHFDHLGSSASITDSAGSELVSLAHDPHGERRKPDWTRRLNPSEIAALAADYGDRTSRGFTGHEHLDRTGLVHMNGRLYDPLLGRFLSPDLIVANPADGQQWNLYSYAMNSPLSYVDPSGLTFCDPAQCVTYTQYRLHYPHFGKPAAVAQYDREYSASAETLWERYVTYENNRIRHASRNRTDLPQVRFETDLIYEGGTQLGATHTKYALELTSDGYPETLERTTKAGHSVTPRDPPPNRDSFWGNSRMFTVEGLQRRTITETVFRNRTGTHWLIGFADYVTVKQGTGSAERTIKTDPAPYGDTNAVDTATRFPGDMNLEFTTNHDYDGYGNRERTTVEAKHADERETSIGGFAAARYPTSITNAAEHVEQLEHDARLGLPIKATDANNRVARLKYDALGREVERVREWDKSATTTTSYDSCTMCDVTVAAGKCSFDESRTVKPAMVSETISPMTRTMQGAMSREAPTTRRYFDKLGRPIRTEVEAFKGDNPRRVDAFYDARGRLACESAPYHSDETPHYTTYAYDVRDRVTAVIRPDGGSTAIVYGAVGAAHRVKATATQTVKEAGGTVADTRARERLYNILGELVEATDGSDQMSANKVTTTYVYDTSGLLETVTADGVETSFEYDAAGNRESVTNPDMGTAADGKSVKFAYTGLGQVRERTDGRGTTSYRYDLLGRPTSRVDPAGGMKTVTATWSYDPTNGKGRLASRGYGGHGVLGDVRVQRSGAAGGDDDDYPGREYDRDARRELRLRPPGPSVDDDLSVGVEGGAWLQRARLSLDAYGRDDGDEEDAGEVRRDGRAREHRDGDLRQRGGDDARIRPEDGPAEIDRHVARDFDVPEPRLRVADGRFAREPHRERGGQRRDGADAQEGGVRLRLPGAPRQRGDEAGRGDDGEPDAGLRVRQSRQPDVEDERRERGRRRDVDHVRAEIGGTARADAGDGGRCRARLPLRRAGPPGAGRRGERGRPFHRVGRPRLGDEGDGGDGEGRGEAGGAGDVPIRPGRGAVSQDERVEGGRRGRDGRPEVGDDLLRRRLREDDAGVHRWRGRIRDGVDGVGGAHARRPGAACETDAVRELEREPGGDRVSALRPPRLVGFDHGRGGGGAGRPRARPARGAAQAGLDAAAERVGDRDPGNGPRGPDFAGIHGARAPGPDGAGAHERPPVRPAARAVS